MPGCRMPGCLAQRDSETAGKTVRFARARASVRACASTRASEPETQARESGTDWTGPIVTLLPPLRVPGTLVGYREREGRMPYASATNAVLIDGGCNRL